jgi:hypothetical protein
METLNSEANYNVSTSKDKISNRTLKTKYNQQFWEEEMT